MDYTHAGIRTYKLEIRNVYCCLGDDTAELTYETCDRACNHTIGVVCQTYEQAIWQKVNETLQNYTILEPSFTGGTNQESSFQCPIVTPLGAVSGILVALLVVIMVGWIVTCVVWRRSVTLKQKMFLK